MIVAVFLVLTPIVLLLLRYKTYIKKYEDIAKLSGPSLRDIINFYRFKSSNGIVDFFQSLNKRYGSIVKIWIKPLRPVIITTDLEFVEKIYKSNDFFYTPAFSETESLLRNGMATTKSRELWKNDKQIIVNALTPTYISSRLSYYNKKYDEFIETITENLGKSVDVEPILYRTFAEIIITSINDPQIKVTDQEVEEYIKNKTIYMDLLLEKMNSPNMVGILHKFTENYRLSLEAADKVIQLGEEFLRRHKALPAHEREKNNLFYAMMDGGMPDDRIVDNINSMIGGGYDTSVLALALTLYELGKRSDLQEKILDEVRSVIGLQSSKQITLNDLNSMTYLNCVVKEAVRLFFPSPFIDRLLTKDVKVKDITIPKETQVIFSMAEILKSEENFINSNVFSPERFLAENFDENARRAFISFGFGAKTCPGRNLAYAAMKLFIAKVVTTFEIRAVENDHEVQLKADVVFRSVNGIPIIFQKRIRELYM